MKNKREENLLMGLNLDLPGLEVSPLFRPIALKAKHNVYYTDYTDYTSAEDSRSKHANYEHDEIMEIDFIWTPGKRLINCVENDMRFNWAVSSHVMEHVPDPIGWLIEIFEVLKPGAVLSLALPDKRFCFDLFRRDTDVADLVDVWIRQQKIPSPRQIFDFLSRSVDDSGVPGQRPFEVASCFEVAARHYTDDQALEFVKYSWTTGNYLDAHCSVFTPESFVAVFDKINALGILNVTISEPIIENGEFIVKMIKIGEPRVLHPGLSAELVIANLLYEELVIANLLYEESKNPLKHVIKHTLRRYLPNNILHWVAKLRGRV